MIFKVVCRVCGWSAWIRGVVESDTNATVLNEHDDNWNDCCKHLQDGGDYDIVDQDYSGDDYE